LNTAIMRHLYLLLVVASVNLAIGQTKPAPELARFDYLIGEWQGSFGPLKGVLVNEWVEGGRFMRSTMTLKGPEGTFSETSYLGWDPKRKKYSAWNFNGMAALPRIEEGTLEGDALVLVSDPWEMGGIAAVSRGTSKRITDTEIAVKVEVKQGDRWMPMYDGKFAKVVIRAGKAKLVSKGGPPPNR